MYIVVTNLGTQIFEKISEPRNLQEPLSQFFDI